MKILLTGATGYIGKRLLPVLVDELGHDVVALVRSKKRFSIPPHLEPHVEVYEGDLLKPETLEGLPRDCGAAYFLVHSMSHSGKQFMQLEERCAQNFADAVAKTNINQIIYLSGLVNDRNLSDHLRSRLNVETILKKSKVPCTILRAGIIIGSGSASFEIIRDLVEKLPAMVAPRWVANRCQPISIYDVVYYLTRSIANEKCYDKTFDIGGPDKLTYKEMLLQYAEVRKLKRFILQVPVLTPRLSSYWLYFVTSTNFTLAQSLVDSLKNEAVCGENTIKEILPRPCLSYKESIKRVFKVIDQNAVLSSWKDSLVLSELSPDLQEYIQVPQDGCVKEIVEASFQCDPERVVNQMWSIGGRNGWYFMNWAWKLRGFMDKLVGGVGLDRGRTNTDTIHIGDSLDFWRVILADREEGHLLLFAEMKVPGEAWLEWEIKKKGEGHTLIQTATFRPRGVMGRLYWYGLFPIHHFIFRGMVNAIVSRAEKEASHVV